MPIGVCRFSLQGRLARRRTSVGLMAAGPSLAAPSFVQLSSMDMFAGTIASTSVGMFAIPAGPALALGSTLFATGASLRLEE